MLTDDELGRLLKACTGGRGKDGAYDRGIFDGRRDEVLVRLLADCGLRVSELTGLNLDDVDLEREATVARGLATFVEVGRAASTASERARGVGSSTRMGDRLWRRL